MELYKLFGAPRKTAKIIIYTSETAHFSLQPSGTQASCGQRSVQQNSHNHVRGRATEGQDGCGQLRFEPVGKKNLLSPLLILAPASLSHPGFLRTQSLLLGW